MNYNELNKDNLKVILEDRNFEYDQNDSVGKNITEATGNPRGGAITTIVLSSILLLFTSIWGFFFFLGLFVFIFFYGANDPGKSKLVITIFLMLYGLIVICHIVGLIISIITNTRYLKGKNNKVSAGVWGILFGGFIGGILTLCGV